MDGCTDGTWRERRYFTCAYGRAFFCPYYNLSPDRRFDAGGNTSGAAPAENRKEQYQLSVFSHVPSVKITESWVMEMRLISTVLKYVILVRVL